MDHLLEALGAAVDRRADLLARLHAEGTDAYRLFHGVAEGAPGVTVDRYGPLLLVQTFREPIAPALVDDVAAAVSRRLGLALEVVCNHRGARSEGAEAHTPTAAALGDHVAREHCVQYHVRARHRGQDPWLFLDLRRGRAAVQTLAGGKDVLNLFAYTCGVGVAAAVGGARSVTNVDFAESALEVGVRNAALNGVGPERFSVLRSDCLPVLRQLAGQPVQRRGKHVPFVRVEPRKYDLIVLDPPRLAKSAFGTIDVVNDYASLWKPALLALAEGGTLVATNHVPTVRAADWHAALRRSSEKAGRPLRTFDALEVDGDFPSFDGEPPLKVVVVTV